MSRAGVSRAILATVAVAVLVSCRSKRSDLTDVHFPDPKGPIHVKLSCNNGNGSGIGISITDQSNVPAWIVVKDRGEAMWWIVTGNVTVDSIRPKKGQTLPIVADGPQGNGPGVPVHSKVQSEAPAGNYDYSIFAKCRHTGPGGPDIDTPVEIDPEMIVRPH
jgi:hypothetical protein